ncbi:MAG: molybdenum ABC transporter ATP-binding protein [Burkholderiaceae bacterium]
MIQFDAQLRRGNFQLDAAFSSDSRSLALFGPSGAGKSTVLTLLAGLERPDSGRIVFNGQVFCDVSADRYLPARKRRIGLVFQDAMLFPHLSVRSNLSYGRSRWSAKPSAREQISFDEVVELLGIEPLLERKPGALSGGERQRVAIGRALLSDPDLLLLDEPLASLDLARRAEIMPYLIALRDNVQVPLVIVSHALEEVVRLAEDVVSLDQGKVVSVSPVAEFVFGLRSDEPGFSDVAVLQAEVMRFDPDDQMTTLAHPAGRISLPGKLGEPGQPYRVLVRATDVALAVARPRDVSHRTVLRARITGMQRGAGPLVRVTLALEGQGRLMSLITRQAVNALAIDVGDQVFAMTKATAIDDRAFAAAPRIR